MKMVLTFALGLALSPLIHAKENMTCEQIGAVTSILKADHALTRDEVLRQKLLTDQAFAESLRDGFIEELDQSKLLLLADEVARAHEALGGDVAASVFSAGQCGAFSSVYATYDVAVKRSLRLLPAREGDVDPLKAEIIAAAAQPGTEDTKPKDFATTEDELVKRLKSVLIAGTRNLAGVLSKGGPKVYDEAYDMTRVSLDRFRLKPFTEDEVPRVMMTVILHHLDPHTSYYSREEFDEFTGSMREFVGLGVEIRPGFGGVYIQSVLPNGPAARGGMLKDGDKIVKIDGTAVAGLDIGQVSKLLRGTADTKVKVEVVRATEPKPIEVEVVRGRVSPQETTRREVIDTPTGPIGYLRFTSFSYAGAQAVADGLNELAIKNVRGLVLDLRGNPGGLLNEAVDMIGLFEKRDPARGVYYVGTESTSAIPYVFATDGRKFDLPLIILVDGMSASASEVVAGALQAYGRALVVGDGPTFGKGSVQQAFPLSLYAEHHPDFAVNYALGRAPKGGMVLTSGFYFLPDGTSIQNVGVQPDVTLYAERAISPDLSEKGMFEHALSKPSDLGGRLIPQGDVDKLKPYRERLAPARAKLRDAFAGKKEELRTVNPQDPEKAASIFLMEELIKQEHGA